MLFRKEKKCLLRKLFIIVALLFVPLFIVLKNTNSVSAVSVSTRSFDLRYKADTNSQYVYQNGILYGASNGVTISTGGGATIYQFTSSPVQAGGNSASIHFETNIVATWYFQQSFNPWVNLAQQNVIVCNSSPSASTTISRNLSSVVTLWGNSQASTLTLYGDVTVTGLTAGTDYQFVCAVGSTDYSFIDIPSLMGAANVWFEQNPMTISWFSDQSQALMQTQINQNQTIINQSQEYYDKTYESIDNIEGQSTSDISDSTSSQTTSIIGTISSFVSALGTVQTGTCELTLPFPQFIGGNTTVNPCTGKDKAPTIVQVGSSMFLIGVFIPFAFMVLKMIYNEIRSFTNG